MSAADQGGDGTGRLNTVGVGAGLLLGQVGAGIDVTGELVGDDVGSERTGMNKSSGSRSAVDETGGARTMGDLVRGVKEVGNETTEVLVQRQRAAVRSEDAAHQAVAIGSSKHPGLLHLRYW